MATSNYYVSHSGWSDPGQRTLPLWSGDLRALSRAIAAIIRHPVARSSAPFTEEQRQDLLLREATELMERAAEHGILARVSFFEKTQVSAIKQ